MRTLYDLGPISRAEVARLTGLTRTTVSDVVTGLLDDGVVREIGRGPSSGGKAPILLEVDDDARLVVGLDLGEEHFAGSLVNLRGEIRRVASSSPSTAATATPPSASSSTSSTSSSTAAPRRCSASGSGRRASSTAGPARSAARSTSTGATCRSAAIVAERYGVPVNVANDSQAAALAEYTYAGGDRVPNLIAIRVGRGVGAGLILRGALFQGDGSGAGEIGHVVVDRRRRCRCGRHRLPRDDRRHAGDRDPGSRRHRPAGRDLAARPRGASTPGSRGRSPSSTMRAPRSAARSPA